MRRIRTVLIALATGLAGLAGVLVMSPSSPAQVKPMKGKTYYVRQTVGDDANDGLSPKTAWRHVEKLAKAMEAGDTAYVGPGLYREQVLIANTGSDGRALTFIADSTGEHTGDPPGVVMVTGADPVDPGVFAPGAAPGVFRATMPEYIWGVVEMDGDQRRYERVTGLKETLVDKMDPVDAVAKLPSTFFYDERIDPKTNTRPRVLYVHTSDGKPPGTHEIELVKRLFGFHMATKFYITISGFAIRHVGDAGIFFGEGSGYGVALNNTAYGNRQGIRAMYAQNIVLVGNTLFRNENAGLYYLRESTNGAVIGNIAYENVKGIRVGAKSVNTVIVGNTAFENDWGFAFEQGADDSVLLDNRAVNNKNAQVFVMGTQFRSDDNCFESRTPEQKMIEFHPSESFKTLADYQRAKRQDFRSREKGCGALPEKVDVRKLHAESTAYAERARKLLSGVR
jgi:parallel beta-helix repeat protein